VPQIYVGGVHLGGATELFDASKDGRLAALLKEYKVSSNPTSKTDPYSFLPGWLHSRN
jgi:cysteine synthase A